MINYDILSQWAWFSMSTINFIGSGQNHPLLDDRWIARSANYAGNCVFNSREPCVLHDASVRKRILRAWRTPRDYDTIEDGQNNKSHRDGYRLRQHPPLKILDAHHYIMTPLKMNKTKTLIFYSLNVVIM